MSDLPPFPSPSAAQETAGEGAARPRRRGCRSWVRAASVLYLAAMLVLWAALRWWGEANLFLAFLLFVPPHFFLLPLVAGLPAALICDRRASLALQAAAAAFVVFAIMGWEQPGRPQASAEEPRIRVLTHNRGQNRGADVLPFARATQPDVILLQEMREAGAWQEAEALNKAYPFSAFHGEFAIFSRLPILSSEMVSLQQRLRPRERYEPPVAVRHVLDFEGRQIAVYNVHLPSPRDALLKLRQGRFLLGLAGLPGTRWAESRRQREQYWHRRLEQARQLNERLRSEPLPCIAGGDFNAPSQGRACRLLRRGLQDAHEAAGRGFGFTFPGHSRLGIFEPWLRIDYLLASPRWQILESVTEAQRSSQHLALAATFALPAAPQGE